MIRYIFFDLGNVLLPFDHSIAIRNLATLASADEADIKRVVFDSGLQFDYEAGKVSSEEFCNSFCQELNVQVEQSQIMTAASVDTPIGTLDFFDGMPDAPTVEKLYDRYNAWATGIAGLTPIPYKLFTISGGAFKINFKVFMLASLVSPGQSYDPDRAPGRTGYPGYPPFIGLSGP